MEAWSDEAEPTPGPAPAAATAPRAEAELPLDPRFAPERFRADVAFLADDLLEGRDIGSRGHEIAARFVAQRFAALGLEPLGDRDAAGQRGWLQRITFQKTSYTQDPAGFEITGPAGTRRFAHGQEVIIAASANAPELDLTAPLVFAGYGIDDPRVGINDYARLDVKGKIVVVLRGYPTGMPSEVGANLSATKAQMAERHGAIGVITLATNASLKVRPWERLIRTASTPSYAWVGPDGRANEAAPGIRLAGAVNDEAAAALLAGAPRSLAQIRAEADKPGARPRGFALRTTLRGFVHSRSERITSTNVVALLPGGDPALRGEHVVLSAHLDHLGITPPRPGASPGADTINNGAMDNAAGVATTLAVAQAMATEPAPRRSVLFVVTTGEERGLLGADYFATHPTVPAASIVGNVDLDMPVLLYPFTDVIAFGADHSTLGPIVADAVRPMQLTLSPDPMPAETLFVRSDHYRFVRKGVPAVFLATGFANGGAKAFGDFLAKDYHQPSDDLGLAWNWRAGARFAEANWRITRAMANRDAPPLWYQGDYFGDTFAPGAPKAPRP
ncbi:M28 family peptidase [Novosphingobium piscinae]|uniref:M28 family peptidase n=1 Tax=Novosphingobium piscinae TaxID=1507448 RepID=A0A7X1KP13_9SPHN|nr:M28 family peptidase [Novosphingobium piscinae]